ncbi:hypothetical protein L211DRAFT_847167 [Terfezia boudieri ATCC MYA-4762]|uniref:Uncharacterized protein n=1 Tax=Terfezia boudieri ATCC MYA-4762 TaxID=1051890 RepID=A0A3N4LUF9_9PEZI|nr:hypothetical protein L211DRAFT_847167 [Terfezia boudieri ATCC MYA-4762]
MTTSMTPLNSTGHKIPQQVTFIDVPDEELGLVTHTDPEGMMMLSAKMVEIIQEEDIASARQEKMGVYVESLSEEERDYLVAAVEKRARSDANPKRPDAPQPQPYIPPQGRPFIPDPYYEIPAHQYQPQFIPTAVTQRTRKARQAREPKPRKHIKIMHQGEEWDPVESLRKLPVTGLDYGNLFDWAPGIRIAVGKALQIEKGDEKSKGKKRPEVVATLAVQGAESRAEGMAEGELDNWKSSTGRGLIWRSQIEGGAYGILKEPTIRIMNFHTEGLVWPHGWKRDSAYRIGRILIDGGAVVNLMLEGTARRLGLQLKNNDNILIRTATNEIRAIEHYTQFDIEIAGVVASIRAYVIDIPQSYALLLGRRWLYQVRAFGDYAGSTYVIYDAEGRLHEVTASKDSRLNHYPEILLNPNRKTRQSELTAREEAEITLGYDKMQAIISRVVEDAKEQDQDWEETTSEEDEEEGDVFLERADQEEGREEWGKGNQQ